MSAAKAVTFESFNPTEIRWQHQLTYDLHNKINFDIGVQTILLTGAVGSAKSTIAAHIAIKHMIENPGAVVCVCRKNLTDLKETIWLKLLEQLSCFKRDSFYFLNMADLSIKLRNGSRLITRSWSDGNYQKFRSLELSMLLIEEFTEMQDEESTAFEELFARVGRVMGVRQNMVLACTNPDSPTHWIYDKIVVPAQSDDPTTHIYYSRTRDNPFLPWWYVENLEKKYDPKMAKRMLEGEWLEIGSDGIYYNYDSSIHFRPNQSYKVNRQYPIWLSWDFNIGEGKPFSSCAFQYIDDHFHFFDEVIVEGMRTLDSCEEWASRGVLDFGCEIMIAGDATGAANSTKSIHSDWDIIKKFMANYDDGRLKFTSRVKKSNPPIVQRHNDVRSYLMNSKGEVRLTVYQDCPTLDKGFRLTQWKTGSRFIENDGPKHPYQHVTTAAGYGIVSAKSATRRKGGNMRG